MLKKITLLVLSSFLALFAVMLVGSTAASASGCVALIPPGQHQPVGCGKGGQSSSHHTSTASREHKAWKNWEHSHRSHRGWVQHHEHKVDHHSHKWAMKHYHRFVRSHSHSWWITHVWKHRS